MLVSMTCPNCGGYAGNDVYVEPALNNVYLDGVQLKCLDCGCNFELRLKVKKVDRGSKSSRLPSRYVSREK